MVSRRTLERSHHHQCDRCDRPLFAFSFLNRVYSFEYPSFLSIVSVHRFCPSSLTRWTRQNRRWIGLSFAASHFIHLALILTISLCFPEPFLSEQSMGQWVFGGVGYLFVFLMAITSTDKSQRWMGMKHWRRLHVIGSYWLWTVFLLTYIKHAKEGGEWFFVPLLIFTTALLPIRLAKNLPRKPSLQSA